MFKISRQEIEIDGKKIILETGKVARQADGAIIATCGETVVIATVVGAKKVKPEATRRQRSAQVRSRAPPANPDAPLMSHDRR